MRSIRPQTVTLAVLAILFGLGAAWAAKQVLLAKREAPPQVAAVTPPEPTVALLVVQSNLAADARIREQDVGQVPVSLEKLNAKLKEKNISLESALKFKQQAVGRILKTAKPAGSWLTTDDFYEIGTVPQLKLKPEMRAVTLRIDDAAISNSIRTGCLIDVLLTAENPDDGTKLTRRLVTAVEVLSPPVSEGASPSVVTSVSGKSYIVLAATPEQANRLALAQQLDGTITVSLCALPASGNAEKLDPNRVNAILSNGDYQVGVRDLLNLPPRPAAPAPPERIIVEQIRGNRVEYVVFTGDNERLSEEEARQGALPAAGGNAVVARPAKRCKKCEEAAKKRAEEAKRRNAPEGPAPSPTPGPTPAPRSLRVAPPSNPAPVSPTTA